MVNIPETYKELFCTDTARKHLTINIPELDLTIPDDNIIYESLDLTERIMDSNNIEFVGCISTVFKIQLTGITDNLKGKQISVELNLYYNPRFPLFSGKIDSCKRNINNGTCEIVAYDALYDAASLDCTDFFNKHAATTIENLRKEVLAKIGVFGDSTTGVNDGILIRQNQDATVKKISALDLLKSICQINGCFGRINRNGLFENYYLDCSDQAKVWDAPEKSCKAVKFEDFKVRPVDRVEIRASEDDEQPGYYGSGNNTYIIQGNIFTVGLDTTAINGIAHNIYDKINSVEYTPFTAENMAFPWLECGEYIRYYDSAKKEYRKFLFLGRSMKGVQLLTDKFEANGNEYQNEFLSDLSVSIEEMKKEIAQVSASLNQSEKKQLKVQWVNSEQEVGTDPYTFYCLAMKS